MSFLSTCLVLNDYFKVYPLVSSSISCLSCKILLRNTSLRIHHIDLLCCHYSQVSSHKTRLLILLVPKCQNFVSHLSSNGLTKGLTHCLSYYQTQQKINFLLCYEKTMCVFYIFYTFLCTRNKIQNSNILKRYYIILNFAWQNTSKHICEIKQNRFY